MEVKTWDQLGLWLAVQFPVVAICGFAIWYALRWSDRKQAQLLAEKERQIGDQEKRIAEYKAERDKLMALMYPSWGRAQGAGGGAQP